ncbi:signal transduction histidine kinase [Tuber borchii]|uniref:Signal transduction histidine kinase n=1 Tax=Tuber borchii TaxID=42251 RepID=A0A2T6ZAM3_TUBBO|nr:signal transduction histidine kinase [Tuber borchii]
MPSKDTDTITTKETAAVEESESYQSEQALANSYDTGSIDRSVFDQILEMDDDEERDFSRTIVFGFMEQAEQSFKDMEDSLKGKDLAQLSSLGHFLKGSSATLGLVKVQDYCEKIQNLGSDPDKTRTTNADDREERLAGITSVLGEMKEEYKCVCVRFRKFYDDLNGDSQL